MAILKWGLRLFFWIAMTMALRQGSLFGVALCGLGFLTIECFIEDLEEEL